MPSLTESSPLLPKTEATTTRRRSTRNIGKRNGNKSNYSNSNGSSNDDDNSGDDYNAAGFLSPVHTHQRRHVPLSYVSDSNVTPSFSKLGAAPRKPRWTGFRSSKIASQMEAPAPSLLPRVKTRRNRFRSSDYEDAVGMRRRKPPTEEASHLRRVAAYCTCNQISVFKLLKWLDKTVKEPPPPSSNELAVRFHLSGWKNKMYMGVVHSSLVRSPKTGQDPAVEDLRLHRKDAFYFATGCCVFWGLTIEEEAFHLQALAPFTTARVAEIQAEDMEFMYGEVSRVANDEIVLSSDKVEEKLAISFAMAQSAKLDVFEERVEDRIRNTKHIPFNLATTGSIQYSQTDISKLIGQLFIELADVNLHSDILDEPDFLWEDDEYEPLYKKVLKYMDVNNRVKILNKRLDILRELVEVLNQELTQQHGTKLEWIIIWLLVAEILISVVWNMLIKDIMGFFNRQ